MKLIRKAIYWWRRYHFKLAAKQLEILSKDYSLDKEIRKTLAYCATIFLFLSKIEVKD